MECAELTASSARRRGHANRDIRKHHCDRYEQFRGPPQRQQCLKTANSFRSPSLRHGGNSMASRHRRVLQCMDEECFRCSTPTLTTREVATGRQLCSRKRKHFPRSTSPDSNTRAAAGVGQYSGWPAMRLHGHPGTGSSSADSSSPHRAASREEDSRNRQVPPMSSKASCL